VAYGWTPSEIHTKIMEKSTKFILIGHGINSKACRLWNPEDDVITEFVDVCFNESECYGNQTLKLQEDKELI
jgi:hypothetical protein